MEYNILGRISNDRQRQNLFSYVIGDTNQAEEVTPYNINQSLQYYYTLDEDNIFSLEARHLLKNEDLFYNAVLENDPNEAGEYDPTAANLRLNSSFDTYKIGQNRRIKSNQLDAKLDYFHILNPRSNLNFTLGIILSSQEFNSNLFQFLNDGTTFNPTPIINDGLAVNHTQYNFTDVYLGAHYRVKTGKFTITPGFSIHAYGNKNTQFGETFKDNFLRLLPDFETRIQFKKSESLT